MKKNFRWFVGFGNGNAFGWRLAHGRHGSGPYTDHYDLGVRRRWRGLVRTGRRPSAPNNGERAQDHTQSRTQRSP